MAQAEMVKSTKIHREDGYIYYIDDDGNVSRKKETDDPGKKTKINVVKVAGVEKEPGYAYFLDEKGDIRRACLEKVELSSPPPLKKNTAIKTSKVKKLRKK